MLAAMHAGMLELSCRACDDAPDFKKLNGCEEPTQSPVWDDGEENEFYSCPMYWVTDSIHEWYEEYSYCKEFGMSICYQNQSKRFFDAWLIYKYWYDIFCVKKQKNTTDKTGDSLSNLRDGFKMRHV